MVRRVLGVGLGACALAWAAPAYASTAPHHGVLKPRAWHVPPSLGWTPLARIGGRLHEPEVDLAELLGQSAAVRPKHVVRLRVARSLAAADYTALPRSNGATSNQSGRLWVPADVQLAVGAGDVVQVVNGTMTVWTTGGMLLKTIGFNDLVGSGDTLGDPRIVYDAVSGRWFAAIMDATAGKYGVHIGVSQTSDPTGSWWFYLWTATSCLDQPRIGISSSLVVFTANAYDSCAQSQSAVFLGSQLWALNKSELVSGQTTDYAYWDPNVQYFSVTPVQSLSASDPEYAVSLGRSTLNVFTFTGLPPGQTRYTTSTLGIGTLTTPVDAVQAGTSDSLDSGTIRALDAVWLNGTVWVTSGDSCTPPGDSSMRSCARVIAATTSPAAVVDDRDLTLGPGTYVFYPAARADGAGSVDVVFGYSSANDYASVGVTTKPVTGTWSQWTQLARGSAAQTSGRWGDYFGASVDPATPGRVWLSGQFSQAVDGSRQGWGWGTVIATVTTNVVAPTVSYPAPSAIGVDSSSASLVGSVDPANGDTTYRFEYGTSTIYASSTPWVPIAAGAGFQSVSTKVTGLSPSTVYHFRIAAENDAGTTYGIDQTFTTAAPTPPPVAQDTTPPRVQALPSSGKRGRVARLRYRLWEDSGETHEEVGVVTSAGRAATVKTTLSKVTDGASYYVTWKVPAKQKAPVGFCVTAWDRAGNRSAESCAKLSLG